MENVRLFFKTKHLFSEGQGCLGKNRKQILRGHRQQGWKVFVAAGGSTDGSVMDPVCAGCRRSQAPSSGTPPEHHERNRIRADRKTSPPPVPARGAQEGVVNRLFDGRRNPRTTHLRANCGAFPWRVPKGILRGGFSVPYASVLP